LPPGFAVFYTIYVTFIDPRNAITYTITQTFTTRTTSIVSPTAQGSNASWGYVGYVPVGHATGGGVFWAGGELYDLERIPHEVALAAVEWAEANS
jgi:hypothetical protein